LKTLSAVRSGIFVTAFASAVAGAQAATFVYVSNADDGDITSYRMSDSGELTPLARTKAASVVMPMAVSPDRRFLYAAARSKPYTVYVYSIDRGTGALAQVSSAPLAESFPYISLDRTGRYLLAASYGGSVVSVNAVGSDGRVSAEPLQVIPVGRNAHSIRVDDSNRFVYVPTLGSDAIFIFEFDAKTGKLASATPAVFLTKAMTGPRHFVTSTDNRFLYVLGEFVATVTTLAIDSKTGQLTEVSSATGLPPDTKLVAGAPRGSIPGRNMDNDIWAADIQMTPDGKFMYVSERTSSSIGAFGVDGATGKLTYLSSTPTEKQPRGFAIDPRGRYLVATGEKSESVSVYAIEGNGALKPVGKAPTGKGANWVQIVSFD
jgi:6-phosphogluconolactonase